MKVNLLIGFLVLNLLTLNCASTELEKADNDRGFGLKYLNKQKKLEYALIRKYYAENKERPSFWAVYFDLALAPFNLVYFSIQGKLLLSDVGADGEVHREYASDSYERDVLALEDKIKDDDEQFFENNKKKSVILAFLDFSLLSGFNLLYYPFSKKTILGTIDSTGIEGYDELEKILVHGSVKQKRARTYIRKLAVLKENNPSPFEIEPYLEKFYPNSNGQIVQAKLSYSADRIMEYTTPEDFDEALEDANWDIEDLELSETEIQELKENGYLATSENVK